MKDEPTGSPPLSDEQSQAISQDIEKTLGPPPQSDDKTVPTEVSETSTPELATEEPVDEAVDDIVKKDSDELLAAEDAKLDKPSTDKKPGFKQKLKSLLVAWWRNKRLRYATLIGVGLVLTILLMIPTSRYFILNNLSVRASASMTVMDDSTSLPLKNAQVSLGGQTAQSDENGTVHLYHVKLGRSPLVVSKRAFASKNRTYVVGWGSNPLDAVSLTPVGTQYVITVNDFLSNQPIAKAQAESGEANAQSDEKGKILLTVDKPGDQFSVTIKTAGYRDETITISADDKKNHSIKLVPARKEVFVSKRSGKYDIYTVDLDGKNEKLILAGTGNEQDGLVLVPHPAEEVAALVSTRENVRNSDGFLLSSLLLIDLKTGETTKLGQSERIQVVDWIGNRLVYVQIAAGASAANPRRERLISYDYQSSSSVELAATNYFNDILSAGGNIYYAPSTAYQKNDNIGLFRIGANGTNRTSLLNSEVWNIFRTDYDKLSLSVQQNWYNYHLGDKSANKANGAPAVLKTRLYLDNPSDQNSLWVDNRDGKGVLLLYDLNDKKDKILQAQSGLQYPVRWLNKTTVIYRIHNDQETADYAISTQGGEPRKLSDVTNTAGVSSWYYY